MAKKLLFTSFSIFLIYQTFMLMKTIAQASSNAFNIQDAILIGFVLNLFTTGIFAFPGFVFPTNSFLGTGYYRIKNPKALKRVYNLFQVEFFRKLLLFFFWGRGKNRTKYFDGTRKGLINFSYQSRQSEFGHAASFATIAVLTAVPVFYGHYTIFLAASVFNIIGNFYPVILQRYHRIRIDKILSSAREQSSEN